MQGNDNNANVNVCLEEKVDSSATDFSREVELEEHSYIVPKVLSPYVGAWLNKDSYEKAIKEKKLEETHETDSSSANSL